MILRSGFCICMKKFICKFCWVVLYICKKKKKRLFVGFVGLFVGFVGLFVGFVEKVYFVSVIGLYISKKNLISN